VPRHLIVLLAGFAIILAGVRGPSATDPVRVTAIAANSGTDGSHEDDSGKPSERCEEQEENEREDLHLPTTICLACLFSGHSAFLAPATLAAKPRLVRFASLIRGPPAACSADSRRA
jgi:hypothetical protein